MNFGKNIKLLRQRRKMSQEDLAIEIGIKRSSLSGYENQAAEPDFETLIRISAFFHVPLDRLLKTSLGKLSEHALNALEKDEPFIDGSALRVLATTVDNGNVENIELVPVKARAGYTSGYADPDYIKVLPAFNLPFLDRNRKYRTFQIVGDSMPPVSEGSWVTGEYVQNWNSVRDKNPYIIITKDEGIVFKIVYNKIRSKSTLLLCSTNPIYEPYEINIGEVLEIWKFTNYISSELPEPNLSKDEISSTVMKLQKDMSELKNSMKG